MDWQQNSRNRFDWLTIFICITLMILGWINIYAAVYDENHNNILDITQKYGKQLIWVGAAAILAFFILLADSKFFTAFAYFIYGGIIFLLLAVLVLGKEVNGARAWFEIGSVRLQPAEFAKFATALAVAHLMSRVDFKLMSFSGLLRIGLLILIPMALILKQNDTGSALVYVSFLFAMYREGLYGSLLLLFITLIVLFILTLIYNPMIVLIIIITLSLLLYMNYRGIKECGTVFIVIASIFGSLWFIKWLSESKIDVYYLLLTSYALTTIYGIYYIYKRRMKNIFWVGVAAWTCIVATFGVDYVFDHLQPHQQDRINNLLGITSDLSDSGYNVHQSKIAIGSGGFSGKGYLQGTQTKFNFVPEQSTDFIFCTVGEEWGFVGTFIVIILLLFLLIRLIVLSERQRSPFSRIYGYCVVGILFFHIAINIGMTIGLAPVIGIPLPFFSYGGSSLWAFTILIFIFIRLDTDRLQVFS